MDRVLAAATWAQPIICKQFFSPLRELSLSIISLLKKRGRNVSLLGPAVHHHSMSQFFSYWKSEWELTIALTFPTPEAGRRRGKTCEAWFSPHKSGEFDKNLFLIRTTLSGLRFPPLPPFSLIFLVPLYERKQNDDTLLFLSMVFHERPTLSVCIFLRQLRKTLLSHTGAFRRRP